MEAEEGYQAVGQEGYEVASREEYEDRRVRDVGVKRVGRQETEDISNNCGHRSRMVGNDDLYPSRPLLRESIVLEDPYRDYGKILCQTARNNLFWALLLRAPFLANGLARGPDRS